MEDYIDDKLTEDLTKEMLKRYIVDGEIFDFSTAVPSQLSKKLINHTTDIFNDMLNKKGIGMSIHLINIESLF
jgi:hypothetical protein